MLSAQRPSTARKNRPPKLKISKSYVVAKPGRPRTKLRLSTKNITKAFHLFNLNDDGDLLYQETAQIVFTNTNKDMKLDLIRFLQRYGCRLDEIVTLQKQNFIALHLLVADVLRLLHEISNLSNVPFIDKWEPDICVSLSEYADGTQHGIFTVTNKNEELHLHYCHSTKGRVPAHVSNMRSYLFYVHGLAFGAHQNDVHKQVLAAYIVFYSSLYGMISKFHLEDLENRIVSKSGLAPGHDMSLLVDNSQQTELNDTSSYHLSLYEKTVCIAYNKTLLTCNLKLNNRIAKLEQKIKTQKQNMKQWQIFPEQEHTEIQLENRMLPKSDDMVHVISQRLLPVLGFNAMLANENYTKTMGFELGIVSYASLIKIGFIRNVMDNIVSFTVYSTLSTVFLHMDTRCNLATQQLVYDNMVNHMISPCVLCPAGQFNIADNGSHVHVTEQFQEMSDIDWSCEEATEMLFLMLFTCLAMPRIMEGLSHRNPVISNWKIVRSGDPKLQSYSVGNIPCMMKTPFIPCLTNFEHNIEEAIDTFSQCSDVQIVCQSFADTFPHFSSLVKMCKLVETFFHLGSSPSIYSNQLVEHMLLNHPCFATITKTNTFQACVWKLPDVPFHGAPPDVFLQLLRKFAHECAGTTLYGKWCESYLLRCEGY